MKKLVLALSLMMVTPYLFAQLGPTWAKDDFTSPDPFSGAYGGVYWYLALDKGATGTLDRTTEGLRISFNQPEDIHDGFGVTFDGAELDLSNNATINLEVAYIDGDIDDLLMRIQLKDAHGNGAEIVLPQGVVDWDNRKTQVGFEIPKGQSVEYVKSLLGLQVVVDWSCGDADACPTTTDIFDYTRVTELYFIPLNPFTVDDVPQAWSGEFVVTNFSIGEVGTVPATPEISYTYTGTEVVFTWSESETAGATYLLQRKDGDNWNNVTSVDANTYSMPLANVSDGDEFRVFTTIPSANLSSAAGYTELQDVPDGTGSDELAAPDNVAASNVGTNTLTLSWNAVAGATGYRVEKEENGAWTTVQTITGTTYTVTDLSPNTDYQFRVIAENEETESAPSEVVPVTTADEAGSDELAAPDNVVASNIVTNSVTLNWDAVEGATGYRVEKEENGAWTTVQTITGTTYTVTDLSPNTDYQFRVIAENEETESTPSEVVPVTTPPTVGVFKSQFRGQLSIFPNPAEGLANFVYENANVKNVLIKVANMTGDEVASFHGDHERASLDVSGLSKGVYMIYVIAEGETVAIDKLIVK